MSHSTLIRWSGLALIAGGIASIVFWLLVLPLGTFIGAEVVRHPLWIPSQVMHVVGTMLALLGLLGLYAMQYEQIGKLGAIGFIISCIGTVFFVTDGLLAVMVFPVLAAHAPAVLEIDGAMNLPPVLFIFILFYATCMIGYLMFGAAILRNPVWPRPALVLFLIGAVLFNLPPGPVPVFVLSLGGVLWGSSLIWLGSIVAARPVMQPALALR